MPRINAATLSGHHDLQWARLVRATDELLAEKGTDAVTLADIAVRAGMARNTVYNYAPDKAALLAAVAVRSTSDAFGAAVDVARSDRTATARLRAIVEILMEVFAGGAARQILLNDLTGRLSDTERSSIGGTFRSLTDEIAGVVRQGIDAGELRPVDDVATTVSFLSAVVSVGAQQAARSSPDRRAVLAAEVTDFLLRGLGTTSSTSR